jgi:hypothetical protein
VFNFRASQEIADSQVKPNSLYRVYRLSEEAGDEVRACFLLQITNQGEAEAGFRFTLEGSEPLEMAFMAKDLVDYRETRDYMLKCELQPEDVDLEANTLSSRWEDLEELVARGKLIPSAGGSLAPKGAEFRRHLADWKASEPEAGAAVRWALRCGDEDGLYLILQGLPASAKVKMYARYVETDCVSREASIKALMKCNRQICAGPPTRCPAVGRRLPHCRAGVHESGHRLEGRRSGARSYPNSVRAESGGGGQRPDARSGEAHQRTQVGDLMRSDYSVEINKISRF